MAIADKRFMMIAPAVEAWNAQDLNKGSQVPIGAYGAGSGQLLCPSFFCSANHSDKVDDGAFFFFAGFVFATAGAVAAPVFSSSSLANRSAFNRAVFARSAEAAVSYSDMAFFPSSALCNFMN
jgi:hypothetical protein